MTSDLVDLLAAQLPAVFRWAGAVARQLRRHDVAIQSKSSGNPDTDALTVADLAVQELVVAALRDAGDSVRRCRIEAEEMSGDLGRFASDAEWVLAIDPIDGTREYRDRTGNGYAVMLHLRTAETVHYSLVHLPEDGPEGSWLETRPGRVAVGPDDWDRPARAALDVLRPMDLTRRTASRRILVSGFQGAHRERARAVTEAGLQGVLGGQIGGSLYPLMARGELAGGLFHTPNVYDFPVCLHLARLLGGDAVWVHDGRSVDFRACWRDERSGMLRLPGVVACAADPTIVQTLVQVARGFAPIGSDR